MIMDCRTDSNFIMWPNKRLHTDAAALGGVSKDGRGGSGLGSLILLSSLVRRFYLRRPPTPLTHLLITTGRYHETTTSILTVLSAVVVFGCAPPAQVDIEAERAALREAVEAYHRAGSAVDAEALIAFYAQEALVIPPSAPESSGPQEIRDFVTAFTETPGFEISFDTRIVDISADGSLGYSLVSAVISYDGPDGERVDESVRDFHVWKKQEDGSWQVVIDIWNAAPADEDTSE